jgi:hypothetical protein
MKISTGIDSFVEVGLGNLTSPATGIPPEELVDFEPGALFAERQK